MIVVDTHVLVWAFEDDRRLGGLGRETIDTAMLEDGIAFSAFTVWEIAMLTERGRLELSRDVEAWIAYVLAFPALHLVPLEPAIAIGCNRLPGAFHADPADRIIVATARHLDAPLLTADRKIIAYADEGHLLAIDAS